MKLRQFENGVREHGFETKIKTYENVTKPLRNKTVSSRNQSVLTTKLNCIDRIVENAQLPENHKWRKFMMDYALAQVGSASRVRV